MSETWWKGLEWDGLGGDCLLRVLSGVLRRVGDGGGKTRRGELVRRRGFSSSSYLHPPPSLFYFLIAWSAKCRREERGRRLATRGREQGDGRDTEAIFRAEMLLILSSANWRSRWERDTGG